MQNVVEQRQQQGFSRLDRGKLITVDPCLSTKVCACYDQGICDSYTGSCICPAGFIGRQCGQLESTTSCNNIVRKDSGVCNIISPTTVSTCRCLLEYFRCSQASTFADQYKCAQDRLMFGKCPRGLQFNFNKMSYDHANAVTCLNK
ncbi:unnamed protein product [Adineta steineri]|uniref:EGF-like domain-containing protein n=1 Tax=Adineta steineri TaxID=433720 RepID=A0A819FXB5_9BILA|nr:unnamed protein product [Adineta steineri]CAF3875276.1 unnamed protein product [Adineta steineri]